MSAKARLSPRQIQVLRLAARGLPDKAIAAELKISTRTAIGHMQMAREKLHAANRAAAVAKYFCR